MHRPARGDPARHGRRTVARPDAAGQEEHCRHAAADPVARHRQGGDRGRGGRGRGAGHSQRVHFEMSKLLGMLAPIALLIAASAFASDSAAPDFATYAVPVAAPAKTADPVLVTQQDREFRTMIRRAAHNGKVNFAGHYILSAIGCGSSCLLAFTLDADNGQVTWLPFTVGFTSTSSSTTASTSYMRSDIGPCPDQPSVSRDSVHARQRCPRLLECDICG